MSKIIGITTKINRSEQIKKYKHDHLDDIDLVNVSSDYPNAISDSGGVPLLIPILETYDEKIIHEIINAIDGLLLTGGEDIDPKLYQEKRTKKKINQLMAIDEERDNFEVALLKAAFKSKTPILGICRGHQLINVCFGGSLFQDICEETDTSINHLASLEDKTKLVHDVSIKKNSILGDIFPLNTISVNSFHHQSIKTLAKDFEVIAVSEDQIIEGIAHTGDEWILGVQWHPEMLFKKSEIHRRIFDYFLQVVTYNE